MPAMTATAPEHSPLELHRLLANLLRTGRVEQVRVGTASNPAACRVRTGDLLTTWLPWVAQAAGGSAQARHWRTPALGEPCLLLAPGGDLAQAVVLPGVFSDERPQGSSVAGAFRLDFADTAHIEYLPGAHLHLQFGATTLRLGADAITAAAGGGTLTLDSRGLRGEPDVVSGGVSLREHLHTAVTSGSELSGPPA